MNMIKMICWVAGIVGLIFSYSALAIVNVDNLHFQNTKAELSGAISLTGSATSGNTDKSNVTFSGQVQWNRPEHINLLVLGYSYGENKDERNVNNAYLHARHVRHYSDTLDYEFYTQVAENEFLRLSYRGLYGGGLRFMLGNSDKHLAFMGLGGFHEKERLASQVGTTDDLEQETGRWNIYFMSRYKGERIRFTNTLYWQPGMSDSADRRALFVSILKVKATESISMRISLEIAHDGQPPQEVEETDRRLRTGLEYEF